MRFVFFSEYNHATKITFYHFLQYDGNENMLEDLKTFIDNAYFSCMYGDFSEYSLDLKHLLCEKTVEEMKEVYVDRLNTTIMVCQGTFDFDPEEFYNKDPCEVAVLLDDKFNNCQIGKYFEKK
jgi:hypothetical protein